MLEYKQMFLNMYQGTISSYNTAHEIQDNGVKQTLVVSNIKTLETRQYLFCHAVRRELGISKKSIKKISIEKFFTVIFGLSNHEAAGGEHSQLCLTTTRTAGLSFRSMH